MLFFQTLSLISQSKGDQSSAVIVNNDDFFFVRDGINILKKPMHGKVSQINLKEKCKIYSGINPKFKATRYHSLYLSKKNFPNNLLITSISNDDKVIMSFKHKVYPLYGVQYHPESIETKEGSNIINNFMSFI